ncbi:MAG: helix-hairpin-helix domain-containing protein [Kiritimatiellae bacterium]|nr:helix-hairpin-helix domain-containing protein [Kiritimatiellia bacterium]
MRIASGRSAPTERINLNTAPKEDLVRIPGVGEATANTIIAARPFSSLEDLTRVRGIGRARFEQLQAWLTLD